MPRTKGTQKLKQKEADPEISIRISDFHRQAQLRIMKMETEGKMRIKSLGNFIDIARSRLPKEVLQMTLHEILRLEDDNGNDNQNEMNSSMEDCSLKSPAPTPLRAKNASKRNTATSDDGYVTEGMLPRHTSGITKITNMDPPSKIKTRSSTRNSGSQLNEISRSALKASKKTRRKGSTKNQNFKTPAPYKSQHEYSMITPKVKPNTPLNVLRRPRHGEMVLSMQGSPLLVSAVVEEETANINVPLKNGSVISLLPKDGLRMSNIPALDAETVRQLATLKSHIEKVISFK